MHYGCYAHDDALTIDFNEVQDFVVYIFLYGPDLKWPPKCLVVVFWYAHFNITY